MFSRNAIRASMVTAALLTLLAPGTRAQAVISVAAILLAKSSLLPFLDIILRAGGHGRPGNLPVLPRFFRSQPLKKTCRLPEERHLKKNYCPSRLRKRSSLPASNEKRAAKRPPLEILSLISFILANGDDEPTR